MEARATLLVVNPPIALFIVGMGRSGSSALARTLAHSGAVPPPGLLDPTHDLGYFEPRPVIELNEAILRAGKSSGYDPSLRMQEEGAFDAAARAYWIDRIRAYMSTLPAVPLVAIKEPKTSLLGDMWFEAAELAGFRVATVITVRHPGEVIKSLAKRSDGQRYVQNSPAIGAAWWLKYTLLAERDTRGLPRVFVDYANLLTDWRREVQRISLGLGLDGLLDTSGVEDPIAAGLRHHRESGPPPEPFGTDWLTATYQAVRAAARDEPWDHSVLDRVYEQYGASERGFRLVFDDYRRYRNLQRLMTPGLVRLGLRAIPLASRRGRGAVLEP